MITYEITLDVASNRVQGLLNAKYGDTARAICFHFRKDGQPWNPAGDTRVIFTAIKADGKVLYNPCTYDGDVFVYTFTPQTTSCPGLMHCELRILIGENLVVSPRFDIAVTDTLYHEGDALDSTSEATALRTVADEMNALMQSIEESLANGDFLGEPGPAGPKGDKGDTGTVFTPEVSAGGVLSWTNTGGLTNPDSVSIKGPKGDIGAQGLRGAAGADGVTPTIGENGNWYLGDTDTGKPSRGAAGAQGPQGEPGPAGAFPVSGASVGQTVIIKAVDESGVPTAWEPKLAVVSVHGFEAKGGFTIYESDGNSYDEFIELDETLSDPELPANAKAVGDALAGKLNSSEIDTAVKRAMCGGNGAAWSDAERVAALLRMGCAVDENGFVKWQAQTQ